MKDSVIGLVSVFLYIFLASFTHGQIQKEWPQIDCGQFEKPESSMTKLEYDALKACQYSNNNRKDGAIFGAVIWPIGLPIVIGKRVARNVDLP